MSKMFYRGFQQLVYQLWLLISRTYVNIMKYPFIHFSGMDLDFFWCMKHHGTCNNASEICTVLFGLIFNFCGFFAQISRLQANFCHSWQFATKENTKCHFNSSKMNDSLSCELISCHGRPSRICKNSKVGKKISKIQNQPKSILQFPEASLHVQ